MYNFKCQCDVEYVGRTNQGPETQIGQHVPATTRSGNFSHSSRISQSLHNSAIGHQLFNNSDSANKYDDFFTVLHRVRSSQHLNIYKTADIKIHEPGLGKKK